MYEYEATNRMRFGSVCSGIEAASVHGSAHITGPKIWQAKIGKIPVVEA